MTDRKSVQLRFGSNVADRVLVIATVPPWRLALLSESGDEEEFCCESYDLFECLNKLRTDHLEEIGAEILCYGARIDVYPSRMSREMSGGRKAYILRIGESARRSDLVDIFETSATGPFGSVDEQRRFYERWAAALQ